MFSLDQFQISGANELDSSKVSNQKHKQRPFDLTLNNSHSNSNNRQLFKKCKSIIQEQMVQINKLTEQNDQLRQGLCQSQKYQMNLQEEIQSMSTDYQEAKHKNQSLHKQMSQLNATIQQMTQKFLAKDNQQKLLSNKVQLIQSHILKLEQQNQTFKTKCQLLQQTIQLLNNENKTIRKVISEKDEEITNEIQQLRNVNQILKRRGHVEELDAICQGYKKDTLNGERNYLSDRKKLCNNFQTVSQEPFRTIMVNQFQNKQQQRPTYSKSFQTYYSAQIKKQNGKRCPQKDQMQNVKAFSILDRKSEVSPPSRIRKNILKPPPQQFSKAKKLQNALQSYSRRPKQQSFLSINPEMQSQISNIKKEILQQYNQISAKKQMLNQERISHTLKEIQSKLQKMTKITAIDDSESEFQQ